MSITKHDSNWSSTEYSRLQYSGCNKSTTLMGSESSWHPHTTPATTLYWALLTSVSGDNTKMRHWLNTITRKKNNLLWKLLWHCLFHKVAPWKSNFVCMELAEAGLFCFLEVSDKQVLFINLQLVGKDWLPSYRSVFTEANMFYQQIAYHQMPIFSFYTVG